MSSHVAAHACRRGLGQIWEAVEQAWLMLTSKWRVSQQAGSLGQAFRLVPEIEFNVAAVFGLGARQFGSVRFAVWSLDLHLNRDLA